MKLSWRVILLWTLPLLVVGFFLWQGAFSSSPMNMGRNTASTRMTYGRFLDYLEAGRVTTVDLYDNGRTAIIEAIDPDIDNRAQRWRVDLPGNSPDLVSRLREANISLDSHPPRNDGALLGALGNLLFPLLLIGGLFFLFRRSNVGPGGPGQAMSLASLRLAS